MAKQPAALREANALLRRAAKASCRSGKADFASSAVDLVVGSKAVTKTQRASVIRRAMPSIRSCGARPFARGGFFNLTRSGRSR